MTGGDVKGISSRVLERAAGPLCLAVPAVLIWLSGGAGRALFRFERSGLEGGQYWRLVTGHFTHLGTGHLLLNLAGLAALAWVLAPTRPRPGWWLATAFGSIVAMDVGLVWLQPGLDWYVGLSGLLHGIWAAGAWRLIADRDRIQGGLLAVALAGKLIGEALFGASATTTAISGGDVITAVHLYGAVGGAATALWFAVGAAVRSQDAKL